MQTDLRGDYIGFSFGGVHSSSLGIVRVSDGSRYTQNLLPSFSDRTATVAGKNGVYYFGTDYSQNQISLSIAFDCVEETQIKEMRQLFAPDGTLKELWFDELPYKSVMAKIGAAPQLKYIVFEELHLEQKDGEIIQTKKRIYKGEGTLQFVVYSPFARGRFKYLSEANTDEITNKSEWIDAVKLLNEQGNYDGSGATVQVYNPGDMPTPCKIYFSKEDFTNLSQIDLGTSNPETRSATLHFSDKKEIADDDAYVCVDSKTCLIEGCDSSYVKSGTLYNRYITSGDFFSIPVEPGNGADQEIYATFRKTVKTDETAETDKDPKIAGIEYDYLYYA